MPTPNPNENKDDFLKRCMAYPDMQDYEPNQRYAVCQSKWNESHMGKMKKIKEFAGGVSFDYDGVLSTEKGKELARQTRSIVYIISARGNKDGLETIAKELGIPLNRVYATGSNKAKIEKIKELGISKHYDNNPDVIKELGNKGQLFK